VVGDERTYGVAFLLLVACGEKKTTTETQTKKSFIAVWINDIFIVFFQCFKGGGGTHNVTMIQGKPVSNSFQKPLWRNYSCTQREYEL